MMPVSLAAREIQEFSGRAGEKFCFIGAVALRRRGEPHVILSESSAGIPIDVALGGALRETPETLERVRRPRACVEKGA